MLLKPRFVSLAIGLAVVGFHPRAHVGNSQGSGAGSLDVLPCGAIPPDPGEFVGTEVLGGIIRELRSAYDLVLIDAPPMLRVGDPLTLSRYVDGIFAVSRIGVATRAITREFERALPATTTPVFGVVVTGVGDNVAYGYGGAYGQVERLAEQKPVSDAIS